MKLLQVSIPGEYDYYSLISGDDFPIKSNIEINAFFEQFKGKEFLGTCDENLGILEIKEDSIYSRRYSVFHLFESSFRKKNILHKISNIFVRIQDILKVNRVQSYDICFYKASTWFSITHEFAKYVISKENWVYRTFKHGFCVDEIAIPTLLMNSKFRDALYTENGFASNARMIDWERGRPYTFTMDDLDDLLNSGKIFARKFDENTDAEVIDKLMQINKG